MATVNLLPWREARRQRQQQAFKRWAMAVVALSVVVVWVWHEQVQRQLAQQQQRNQEVQHQLNELDQRDAQWAALNQQHQARLADMAQLEALLRNPAKQVQLLETLARSLPEGIYLTALSQQDSLLQLEGRVDQPATLTLLSHQLEQSPWLSSATLVDLETPSQADATPAHRFRLQLTLLEQAAISTRGVSP